MPLALWTVVRDPKEPVMLQPVTLARNPETRQDALDTVLLTLGTVSETADRLQRQDLRRAFDYLLGSVRGIQIWKLEVYRTIAKEAYEQALNDIRFWQDQPGWALRFLLIEWRGLVFNEFYPKAEWEIRTDALNRLDRVRGRRRSKVLRSKLPEFYGFKMLDHPVDHRVVETDPAAREAYKLDLARRAGKVTPASAYEASRLDQDLGPVGERDMAAPVEGDGDDEDGEESYLFGPAARPVPSASARR
jgi:hypothetical protein